MLGGCLGGVAEQVSRGSRVIIEKRFEVDFPALEYPVRFVEHGGTVYIVEVINLRSSGTADLFRCGVEASHVPLVGVSLNLFGFFPPPCILYFAEHFLAGPAAFAEF